MPSNPPSAVALRHLAFEDMGLLAPILDRAGWKTSYRDAPLDDLDDPEIEQADLLIVLGGPIGVYETDLYPFLEREIALVERRLAAKKPILGICLGAQLMAKASGARVFAGPIKEIGWGRVDLTPAGRASCLAPLADEAAVVLHWHGDTFDLPKSAERLAFNSAYENQAFALGNYGLALQFHLEADPMRLEQWLVGHAVELAKAGVLVPALRVDTAHCARTLAVQAERIFAPWLSQFR